MIDRPGAPLALLTRKRVCYLLHDDCPVDPCTWDHWKVYSFLQRHQHFRPPADFGIDGDDLTLHVRDRGVRRKLSVGLAFLLSYYEHGQSEWRLCRRNPERSLAAVDGIILWEQKPTALGLKTYAERQEAARQFLETYTAWCNGAVYGFRVEKPDGQLCDSCFGFYELEYLFEAYLAPLLDHAIVTFRGDARTLVDCQHQLLPPSCLVVKDLNAVTLIYDEDAGTDVLFADHI